VLDYCLHAGSENVVIYFRDNIYIIKTLKEFQYVDEEGKDQGANVRQKAKDITNLLTDEGRLREERRSRAHMRDRMIRGGGHGMDDEEDDSAARRKLRPVNGMRGKDRDEDELRKAIEESKRSLAEEQAKKGVLTAEERDLQQALRMSEEEEAKRKNAVDDSNASALFDDHNQLEAPNTNPFPFIDPTPYATGLQPQYTQLQPQFTQMQPQFTSFNPYQQQAQQEAMQAEYLRQQQEWLRQQQEQQAAQAALAQQEELMRQQQLMQLQQMQQQQQQQQLLQPQQQPLMTQPTGFGSNNPFAPAAAAPPLPSFSPQRSNASPAPQSSTPSFNLQGTYANSSAPTFTPSNPSPAPRPPSSSAILDAGRGQTRADQEHAQLASLFENREAGQDTFGNVGQLRCVCPICLHCLSVLIFFSCIGMATQTQVVLLLRKLVVCQVITLSPNNSRTANSHSLLFEAPFLRNITLFSICTFSFTYGVALSPWPIALFFPRCNLGFNCIPPLVEFHMHMIMITAFSILG
jgi:epsin